MRIPRRDFLMQITTASLAATHLARAEATPKRYRACVIGDTQHGGHGHNLHRVWGARPDIEVVGLADPDPAGRARRAAEAGAKNTYADFREMLEREKPDLVSIGPRWTTRHKEYLLAAAEAGAHGLLEKPIATDLAEADVMVNAAEAKNLKWAMAFNFRATPVYQHAKRMILEEGIIGEVLEMRGRGKEDHRAGGEDLIVLGTHIFDMMIDLAGRPRWCAADILQDGRPATPGDVHEATEPLGPIAGDRIQAAYGFADGIYGHFATTKNRDGNGGRWGLDIFGSRGMVAIRMTEIPIINLFRNPPWAPMTKPAQWEPLPGMPEMAYKKAPVERYAPIVNGLIDAIENNAEPGVSLRDGRNAYEMIQAVYAAHLNGGRIEMPLVERTHPLRAWREPPA